MDVTGRRLAKARLPEGVAGVALLHAMIGARLGEDADEDDAGQVVVGIETDRGPWVAALIGWPIQDSTRSRTTTPSSPPSMPTGTSGERGTFRRSARPDTVC